jgi:SAM-dependent methyltransferase
VLRLATKNAALGIPFVERRYQRQALNRGYDAAKDSVQYVETVFGEHSTRLRRAGFSWAGKDILEIGPGGNLGVCVRFLQTGARSATAVDIAPWAETVPPALYEALGGEEEARAVSYLAPHDFHVTNLPDASFDLVFSHAVLEHVANPSLVAQQSARILRPGGFVSHRIDLRDHANFEKPHEFLRYPDSLWRLMTSNLPWQTNRWRASEHLDALLREGLEIVLQEPTRTAEPSARLRVSRRFAGANDLDVLGIFAIAKKPVPS